MSWNFADELVTPDPSTFNPVEFENFINTLRNDNSVTNGTVPDQLSQQVPVNIYSNLDNSGFNTFDKLIADITGTVSDSKIQNPKFSHLHTNEFQLDVNTISLPFTIDREQNLSSSSFSSVSSSLDASPVTSDSVDGNALTNSISNNEMMQEILTLIGWAQDEKAIQSKRKRENTTKEEQLEKHKTTEKKRRNEMKELIEKLRTIVPYRGEHSKATQVSILQETTDYLTRIQQLCKDLLQENKQLKQMANPHQQTPYLVGHNQQQTASFTTVTNHTTSNDVGKRRKVSPSEVSSNAPYSIQPTRLRNFLTAGSKVVFLSVFLMVTILPFHLPFVEEGESPSTGRVVLETETDYVITVRNWADYLAKGILAGLGMIVVLAISERHVNPKSENFMKAKQGGEKGEFDFFSGRPHIETEAELTSVLELLDRVPPASRIILAIYTIFELFRQFTHIIGIGIIIERLIFKLRGISPEYGYEVATVASTYIKVYRVPDMRWLYIALSSKNVADSFGLVNKADEIIAACSWKLRGNVRPFFILLSRFLDFYISRSGRPGIDVDLTHQILLLNTRAIRLMSSGELEEAEKILCEVITQSYSSPRGVQYFAMMRSFAIHGMLGILTGDYRRSQKSFLALQGCSYETQHIRHACWSLMGITLTLLFQRKPKEAYWVWGYMKHTIPNYNNYMLNLFPKSIEFTLLFYQKKYDQCLHDLEDIIISIKSFVKSKGTVFFASAIFALTADTSLAIMEDSLQITSSIYQHREKIIELADTACSLLQQLSAYFQVLSPIAMFYSGRNCYLLQDYPTAISYWQKAIEASEKVKATSDFQVKRMAEEGLQNVSMYSFPI